MVRKYRNIWINFSCSAAQKIYRNLLQPKIAIAGVRCGQFGTVRLKFQLSTYVPEPLVISRKGCIQRALNGKKTFSS